MLSNGLQEHTLQAAMCSSVQSSVSDWPEYALPGCTEVISSPTLVLVNPTLHVQTGSVAGYATWLVAVSLPV